MQLGALEYLISLNSNNLGKDIKKADNKLTSWAVAKGQMISRVMEKAMATAGDSMKKVLGGAFNSYADYEQLVGGVDTLFKESSKKLQQYASVAYKTVGVSANQYMGSVTSFSASLLQSLGGDTDKAADVADMAMKDMADNMNKMGSSMESIQNAYQGFAKQNYTMLDNLKLGYGGTKSEMQRLLKDATKLTGQKYDIKNLSDVYQAIHAIQEEMGITGTTAKEAEETIAGSMNSAKAAWQDMLTSFGSGKNVKEATQQFADSAKTVIKNATPVISTALKSMITAAKTIWPSVKGAVTDIWKNVESTVKGLMPKGLRLVLGIGSRIMKRLTRAFKQDGLKGILKEMKNIGGVFKTSLAKTLKIDPDASWFDIGKQLAQNLKDKITGASDSTWGQVAKAIADRIKNSLGKIKLKVADILGIEADGDTAWSSIGKNILDRIKNGIKVGNDKLRLKIADILGLEDAKNASWTTIGRNIITRIKTGMVQGEKKIRLKIADILGLEDKGDASWKTIGENILDRIKDGIGKAKLKLADVLNVKGKDGSEATWEDIGKAVADGFKKAFAKGERMILEMILGEGLNDEEYTFVNAGKKIAGWLESAFEEGGFLDTYFKNFSQKAQTIATIAGGLIKGIANWIKDNTKEITEIVTTVISAIISALPAVVDGILELADKLIDPLTDLIVSIVDVLIQILTDQNTYTKLLDVVKRLISAIVKILPTVFSTLTENLPTIAKDIGSFLSEAIKEVLKAAPEVIGSLVGLITDPKFIAGVVDVLKQAFESLLGITWDLGGTLLTTLGKALWIDLHFQTWEEVQAWWDRDIKPHLSFSAILKLFPQIFNKENAEATVGNENWGTEAQQGLKDMGVTVHDDWSASDWDNYMSQFNGTAKGNWRVPYDNFPALLHRDEMVLTKSQARKYRDGEGDGMNYAVAGSVIGRAVEKAMSRVYVMMSGEKVGDLTTKRVRNNMNASSYRKLRALGG